MTKIEILGTGCARCDKLARLADQAAGELGLDYELVKVTDISEITARGVVMTPGLVVDGEVRCVGRVPPLAELKRLLG